MRKKFSLTALLVVLCLAILATGYAAAKTTTLSHDKAMEGQITKFTAWYSGLSPAEQRLWQQAFEEMLAQGETGSIQMLMASNSDQPDMVWIPKSGKRYHKTASCSNMSNPQQVTRQQAESRGLTPFKKCKP